MAICRTCLRKVLKKHEKPEVFQGRASYNYYCEECDTFMNIGSVAHGVIINGDGKRKYLDLQADPKTGD